MMALGIIGVFIILLSLLVYCVIIYDIEIPDEPMTESEKICSKIKLAISDAEWKLKREMGGV